MLSARIYYYYVFPFNELTWGSPPLHCGCGNTTFIIPYIDEESEYDPISNEHITYLYNTAIVICDECDKCTVCNNRILYRLLDTTFITPYSRELLLCSHCQQ